MKNVSLLVILFLLVFAAICRADEAEEACRNGVMGMSIGGAVVTEITKVRVANSAIPIFNLFVNVERGDTPPGIKLMPHVISCSAHKSKSSGEWITTFEVID